MKNPTSKPTREIPRVGVKLLATGSALPERVVTNDDLRALMETSDEWIRQRTGIRERRIADPEKGETVVGLCTLALQRALEQADLRADELDLIIVASVTGGMNCPSLACRVADNLKAGHTAAFDISAACSGWVYSVQIAHDMIRAGSHRRIAVIGCDVMSNILEFNDNDRGTSILFGDAAGAAIFTADDDQNRGIIAAAMHADGALWHSLFIPRQESDIPDDVDPETVKLGCLAMRGREVFKFAVTTFCDLIDETLNAAELKSDDVSVFVVHQSNLRILEAARKRFGLGEDRIYVNIDRVGNSSAGSVPLCLDELRRAGRCREGDVVMFVAFGGGMTWAASLWRL